MFSLHVHTFRNILLRAVAQRGAIQIFRDALNKRQEGITTKSLPGMGFSSPPTCRWKSGSEMIRFEEQVSQSVLEEIGNARMEDKIPLMAAR